jgi:leader peptidase (prepilin peptidase)/N-methyltransferase
MDPTPWLCGLFGLIVGSFLNVCIHRIPRGESIVFPSSHCPHCGARIAPYDNVPLFSYIWLKGRCRSCKEFISPQYPAVEFLNGAAYFACAVKWGFTPPAAVNALFMSIVIMLIFIDYRHQILPDSLTLTGTALGIALSHFQSDALVLDPIALAIASVFPTDWPEWILGWTRAAFGALVGGGILYLVAWLYKLVRKQQGLGMGDVKMMAMVGAFLGWRLALLTVFAGSLLGSLAGIFLISFKGKNLQSRLAFGTFLGLAASLVLFFGPSFIRWYGSLR